MRLLRRGLISVLLLIGLGLLAPLAEAACWLLDSRAAPPMLCPGGTFPTTCEAGVSLAGFDPGDGSFKVCVGGVSGGTFLPVTMGGDSLVECAVVAAVDATDDNQLFGLELPYNITITSVGCRYQGSAPTTPATFTLEDGAGNAMTITGTNPTCVAPNAAITYAAVTAGNVLSANEPLRFDVTNTPNPATDTYQLCIRFNK